MNKIEIIDIKLKIVRGRAGPAEQRFQYTTLIEYILENKEESEKVVMGITPSTYFFIKQVLKEDLNDLERVIYHNIRVDNRKFLQELFVENNLLNISLKKQLIEVIDEVIIDDIKPIGKVGYNFSASIYLNNGQRIPNIIPSDAVVLAFIGKKRIYILTTVLEERQRLDKEYQEKLELKKEQDQKSEGSDKKPEVPKNIYT